MNRASRPGPAPRPRPALIVAAGLAALLALTGCSAVEQASERAVDQAASAAAEEASRAASDVVSQAAGAARDTVVGQICATVRDGTLSDADLAALRTLVDGAGAAGVPADLVNPVRQLVDAGETAGQAVTDRVRQAQAACPA